MAGDIPHSLVAGLNFKTAPLEIREKLSFDVTELPACLSRMIENSTLNEGVILSTCNRVEAYAATHGDPERGLGELASFLAREKGISPDDLRPHLYLYHCEEAVEHLFQVVSSLDSLVVGEYQIMAQVKEAYDLANKNKATGQVLNKLFQSAIQVGKKVRSGTEIGKGAVSVGSVAVDLVSDIFEPESNFKVLLIGAGEVAELTATHLRKFGRARMTIANRSPEKASRLAGEFGGAVVDYSERVKAAAESDIVVVSTGAPEFVLKREEMEPLLPARKGEILVLIDLSVPRNIDPSLSDLGNVILYTVDDLQEIAKRNAGERELAAGEARQYIEGGAKDFSVWYSKQLLVPTLRRLREHFDETREAVLSGFSSRLEKLNDDDRKLLDDVLNLYTKRICNQPLMNLEKLKRTDASAEVAEAIDLMFLRAKPKGKDKES